MPFFLPWCRHEVLNSGKEGKVGNVVKQRLIGFHTNFPSTDPEDRFWKVGGWVDVTSLNNSLNKDRKKLYEYYRKSEALLDRIIARESEVLAEIDDIYVATRHRRGTGVPFKLGLTDKFPKKEPILEEVRMDFIHNFLAHRLVRKYEEGKRKSKAYKPDKKPSGHPRDKRPPFEEGEENVTTYVGGDISSGDLNSIQRKEGSDTALKWKGPEEGRGNSNRKGGGDNLSKEERKIINQHKQNKSNKKKDTFGDFLE